MVRYDRLKINIPKNCITNINFDRLLYSNKRGQVKYEFNQTSPFKLYIEVRALDTIIECSAKVLLDDYPQLLNRDNIRQALGNINKYNIIDFKMLGVRRT